jgi:hypothetical protein
METFLPGLIKRFGPNQPMSISFNTVQAPTSYFHVGTIGMIVNADLTIYVNNEIAAQIRVVNTEGAITINLSKGNLKVQLLTFYIYDATLT